MAPQNSEALQTQIRPKPFALKPSRFPLSLFSSPVFIAIFALLVRLFALYLGWRRGLYSAPYGYEAASVAEAIAMGRGFSSPLPLVHTGPTAWLCPVFPYFLAGVFHTWGEQTAQSHTAIQIANCFFASAAVFPIYAIARKSFGLTVAIASAWLWVFLPSAVHIPIDDIWDTTLAALAFALLFFFTIAVRQKRGILLWAAFGAFWAFGALVNASILSVFPFFIVWLLLGTQRASDSRVSSARQVSVGLAAFALVLMPWIVRNHRVLGHWIPLRSNFGLELWVGNNPDADEINSFTNHPVQNLSEDLQYEQLGEIGYMAAKRHDAMDFIRSHPAETLHRVRVRVALFWFSVTDRPRPEWSSFPLYVKALFLANMLIISFSWIGGISALRLRNANASLFAIVVVVFPLIYYLTHTLVRYRFPIDPILSILSVYGLAQTIAWTNKLLAFRSASAAAPVSNN